MKIFAAAAIIILLLSGCTTTTNTSVYSDTRFMFDTVCTIEAGGDNARTAAEAAFNKIDEVQKAVDFYSDSSTVSDFNRAGANQPIVLDEHTFNIIDTALKIYSDSGGVFDITIAPVRQLWDFSSDSSHGLPSDEQIKKNLAYVGSDKLSLSRERHTLEKKIPGVQIDLGSAAKGYAADLAASVLKEYNVRYALINLGGNVYTLGQNPKRSNGEWQIGIQKPFADTGVYSRVITAYSDTAVVTSGTYQRYFKIGGKSYHHIIDPFTGYPANTEFSGITIKASNALLADCLSTACLILDYDEAKKLADSCGVEIYAEK